MRPSRGWLRTPPLSGVPHRYVVFTVPKLVRSLFERERRLLSILPRCAHEAAQRVLREVVGDRRAQVGTVASIQTFGDCLSLGPRTSIRMCTRS